MTDIQTKRKVGVPFGNWNRLVHGERSKRLQEERRAKWRAEWTEQELRALAWSESCPKVDYARQLDELDRLRREKEAEGDYRWSRRGQNLPPA